MRPEELQKLNKAYQDMENKTIRYQNTCLWISLFLFVLAGCIVFWWRFPELTIYILSKVF